MDTIQTPLYRKAGADRSTKIAAVVIVGLLILSGLAVSMKSTEHLLTGQLIDDVAPPTDEERSERFELIISRTHEQYADMRKLIAQEIEQDLEDTLHGSAPTPQERLQVLREQRWQQEGAWWEFMLDEFARWFGLTR